MNPILELKNISYSYHTPEGETQALSDITFSLSPGEFTAVVGPSGCGKSTLLSLIAGLMRAESGEILLNGTPLTENSSRIGYMLQHDYLFEWRTVYRNIILGAEINGTLDEKTKEKAAELLEQYGSTPIKSGFKLADLIKRPELDYEKLAPLDKERPELPAPVREQVNIQIKYEGYISQQLKQVEQFKKLENRLLPEDLDYETIQGLRLEARQKLNAIRPRSMGHASRITGVSPADISVLLIYMEQQKRNG